PSCLPAQGGTFHRYPPGHPRACRGGRVSRGGWQPAAGRQRDRPQSGWGFAGGDLAFRQGGGKEGRDGPAAFRGLGGGPAVAAGTAGGPA
ncbi:hypothetical protein ABTE19_20955, partial [Acinetobacter baumannii]